jgi:hypothetical protein
MTEETGALQTSHLSRRWVVRMLLIGLALVGFGFWGLYDATVKYPARGREAAEYLEYQYLLQLDNAKQLTRASIDDPRGTLENLRRKQDEGPLAGPEKAAHDWLDQLSLIGKLEPAATSTKIPRDDFRTNEFGQPEKVSDAQQRLEILRKRWTTSAGTTKSASPLSAFDLPSQWIIFVLGLGIGAWILLGVAIAKSRTYRWEPTLQRLTIPGGVSLVPSDIEEFDKRKWHRLFVTLKVKSTHPQVSGKAITLDLLRYEPVEAWVLEMERTAFPEAEAPAAPTPPAAPEAT